MKKDEFGNRMKAYEKSYRQKLPKRLPVLLRIDGKAFHTYTRGMKKPFDEDLNAAMWETMKYLCENIMGAKVGYHQSDEISILVTNYDKLTTETWFDNNVQKIVSVATSLATAKFNQVMQKKYPEKELALFDCRVWVLPHDEVNNYFLWRQQDATKNSISMVAQAHFSPKQLHKKNGADKQDMLMLEKGINWNNLPTWQKRGACVKKENFKKNGATRTRWAVDENIPIFSKDTEYINQFVYLKKDDIVNKQKGGK